MLEYKKFVERLGEPGVQAIIEWIERCEGIVNLSCMPLEERWNRVMWLGREPGLAAVG
jgi:hypothetical protein